MRRYVCVFIVVFLAAARLFGTGNPVPVAVSDLAVSSDNPRYKYVGKGIAEMIAVELRKSPSVSLVAREERIALLDEIEFSLSDLTDSGKQAQLGSMLAARYIVFGDLVDMGTDILISLRMIDVRSAEIVWNDRLVTKLSRYDYIAGYFASAILKHIGAEISRTTVAKVQQQGDKEPEAVIALSKAIDLYDRKENEEARKQLVAAKRMDPNSETTAYYLAKLVPNTTKFKVLMELYYSYLNPAFLGIMRTDMLHIAASTPVYPIVTHNPVPYVNYTAFGADGRVSEMEFTVRLGYAFPVGRSWGLGLEVLPTAGMLNRGWFGAYGSDEYDSARTAAGAVMDVGFAVTESFALGAGLGVYSRSSVDKGPIAPYVYSDKAIVMANGGVLWRNPEETVVFDSRLGCNSETYDIADPGTLGVAGLGSAPLFLENTLTLAYNKKTTFLVLKQISNLDLGGAYTFLTFMPALEQFFGRQLSLRVGLESSLSVSNGKGNFGYGALAGITFRVPRGGLDLDANVTFRQRPSRVVQGLLYSDLLVLFNLSWNDLFVSRKTVE